jgi:predicted  nucleic acid-binding Zn-ribbon protein
MNVTLQQLLKVQDVDSEMILLRESLRMRPREVEDERKKVLEAKRVLEEVTARARQLKMESDRREVDVKKCDAEIEKYNVALNQAQSNQEYTIIKEQIKRQEDLRAKAEEDVILKLDDIAATEAEKKAAAERVAVEEKVLAKKTSEVQQICTGIEKQLAALEARRAELIVVIDKEHLKIYDRVLARTNNSAIARVEAQVCQGCYISVTAQEINLMMLGQFVQCRSCSRLLYLAD